ncbi:hypothetical protein AB5J72_48755 [Streptomyces sp. CG1]
MSGAAELDTGADDQVTQISPAEALRLVVINGQQDEAVHASVV